MSDQPDSVEIQLRVTTAGAAGEWHNSEGPPDVIAAYLRAYADRIDPPKRPTRTAAEREYPTVLELADSPGPASGLRTNIRATNEHRDRTYGGRVGFGPIHAETDRP